jgi:hypothetical protein
MVLTSARLALRELVLSDLDFVAEMLADPVVMRYYPKPLTRVEAQAWIERQRARYARDGHGLWLVSDEGTGRPIGMEVTDRGQFAGLEHLVFALARPGVASDQDRNVPTGSSRQHGKRGHSPRR